MKVLGIDPGVSGGFALLSSGVVEQALALPTTEDAKGRKRIDGTKLAAAVRALKPDRVFVELVGVRPGEGVVGAFSFGRSAGIIQGVLQAIGLEPEYVTPAQWKVELKVPSDKHKARARATELLNRGDLWRRAKDDGLAEAALIALWGYRKHCQHSTEVEW